MRLLLRRRQLVLLPLLLPVAGCESSSKPRRLLEFLDAINAGDEARARADARSDFALTLPDGRTRAGDAAIEALLALPRPIRVRSVQTDYQRQALTTQMTFGPGKAVRVDVTGQYGGLKSMTIHAGGR